MGLLCVIFLIMLMGFCLVQRHKWYSPSILFVGLWIIVTSLSLLRLHNLNETSERIYLIVLLGTVFFLFGGNRQKTFVFGNKLPAKSQSNNYYTRYKLVYVFCIIVIIYLAQRALRVRAMLASGLSMSTIRVEFGESVLQSGFDALLNNYVIQPAITILIPLAMIELFNKNKNKLLLILTVIITTLYAYSDGGRIIFVYLLLHFFLVYSMIGTESISSWSDKFKRLFLLVSLFFVVTYLISYLTEARTTNLSFTQQIYSYLCGCMPHFDIRLKAFEASYDYLYGFGFFHSFIEIGLFVLKNLRLISAYPGWFDAARNALNVSDFVNIGSQNFNAFVTPFFYFFADFGYLGVAAGSFVYGWMSKALYRRTSESSDIRSLVAYMMIVQSIFMSMVRWQFYQVTFTVAFVYIFIFIGKKKEYNV